MKSLQVRLLCPFVLASLAACGRTGTTSTTEGLANSGAGKNAAVVVGAPYSLPGVPTDIREFSKVLKDSSYDFRFSDVRAGEDASVAEIMDLTAQAAKDADSLVWFFSGHGADGDMLANDTSFTFHDVAAAVLQVRGSKPLKRLLVFIDSCHSGEFVDGSSPIVDFTGTAQFKCKCADSALMPKRLALPPSIFEALDSEDRDIYEEAFVIASSQKDENSVDLGAEKGGAFTWSMREVLKKFKTERTDASLADFAADAAEETYRNGSHTPVYKAFPAAAVLGEKLFGYDD